MARSCQSRPPAEGAAVCLWHSLYGAERWVLALIKHLDPAQVETIVGCIRDESSPELPLIEEAERLGFRTLVLEGARPLVASSTSALRGAIATHAIDVVHSHGFRQDVISLLARRLPGRPTRILSTPHGWDGLGSRKLQLYDALNKAILPLFDAVAPLSPGLVDSLRTVPLPSGKLHLISNAVDLAEVESTAPLSSPLPGQSRSDNFIIGYVGQLIPRKGVDILLQALSRLGPNGWSCLVLGDGPSRAALEREARQRGLLDRVQFLGFRPDRLRFLKCFDLFVLPSYREGTPRALLEALAAGIPCIGSGIPGILELLEDGVTGTTFPAGDPARLAEAILLNIRDSREARRLARTGQARVYERHSAAAMAGAYEHLYGRLCGVH
jgi:glycosyltransferase involved in cell wall biosynthesis